MKGEGQLFLAFLLLLTFNSVLFYYHADFDIPSLIVERPESLCIREWEQEYLRLTNFCPTNFENQMDRLKTDMNVYLNHTFAYIMANMRPIGSSWNIVLQNVLLSNPRHFTAIPMEEPDVEFYIKTVRTFRTCLVD